MPPHLTVTGLAGVYFLYEAKMTPAFLLAKLVRLMGVEPRTSSAASAWLLASTLASLLAYFLRRRNLDMAYFSLFGRVCRLSSLCRWFFKLRDERDPRLAKLRSTQRKVLMRVN